MGSDTSEVGGDQDREVSRRDEDADDEERHPSASLTLLLSPVFAETMAAVKLSYLKERGDDPLAWWSILDGLLLSLRQAMDHS